MNTLASFGDRGIGREAGALTGGPSADGRPTRRLRFAILALLLVLAQSAALSHFADHLKPDADEGDGHACVFCLAAHNLDSPLPSPATAVAGALFRLAPPVQGVWRSCTTRLRPPCARAPPSA